MYGIIIVRYCYWYCDMNVDLCLAALGGVTPTATTNTPIQYRIGYQVLVYGNRAVQFMILLYRIWSYKTALNAAQYIIQYYITRGSSRGHQKTNV